MEFIEQLLKSNTESELAYDDLEIAMTFGQVKQLVGKVNTFLIDNAGANYDAVFFQLSSHLNYLFNLSALSLGLRHGKYNPSIEKLDLGSVLVITDSENLETMHSKLLLGKRALFDMAALSDSSRQIGEASRIVFTSGSSGTAKAFEIPEQELISRAELGSKYWSDLSPRMFLLGQASLPGQYLSLICLQLGQPYLSPSTPRKNFDLITKHGVKSIMASPNQILEMLEVRDRLGLALPLELVQIAGGKISKTIAQRLGKEVRLVNYYASSEGGPVGLTKNFDGESNVISELASDLELQIVDDNHNPLTVNTPGTIRYRRQPIAKGYLGGVKSEAFQDGYFYPGDKGMLNESGELVLLGRDGGVANVGGVKINLTEIEGFAASIQGVRDVAAFFFKNKDGIQRLGLAVVMAKSAPLDIVEKLKAGLGEKAPNFVLELDSLPRGENGKVQLEALIEKAQQA